jgi:hypothetical protein
VRFEVKNVFEAGELDINSTVAKFATVEFEGTRQVVFGYDSKYSERTP